MSELGQTGELIPADVTARHAELMREFVASVAGASIAMWHIREEKTYRADGFESFSAFLRSVGMTDRTGKLYANAGPLFLELKSSGHDVLIGHVDMLRPVVFLLNPKKQDVEKQRRIVARMAQIIRTAAAVAKRGQEPLTEKVIARVAERNFGIRSRAKYLEERRQKKAAAEAHLSGEELRARMRHDIELALSTVVGFQRTGYELVQELGNPYEWVGFRDALEILKDCEVAAP